MWSRDNGNYTHALNYPLNENSIVVDLGAFHGVWASQIIEKYNPNVFLFEPVKEFYDYLVDKFQNNPKVKIFNYGIAADYRMRS
jgi:FkbM family methyltransferase